MKQIYCYGMISPSTVLMLAEGFPYPQANTYAEVAGTLASVGGEAANSAFVLARFGVRAVLDGNWVAAKHEARVRQLLEPAGVDLGNLTIVEQGGTEEIVIADGISRTVFGNYASFHSGPKQWNSPSEEEIRQSAIVVLDPYFRDEARLVAELCVKHGVPYVTLDSRHEDYIARNAEAVVVSGELTDQAYKGMDLKDVFNRYLKDCSGLVIFTFGEKDLWYGRRGQPSGHFSPYRITPLDTTGAGDAFRGSIAYGLMQGWDDLATIRFSSAVSAQVCLTMPHALNVPELDTILSFMKEKAQPD